MHRMQPNSSQPLPHFYEVAYIMQVCANSSCSSFYITRILVIICWPFSVVVGLLMNVLSLIIFVRLTRRASRSKRRHAFLAGLAMADLLAVPVGVAILIAIIGNWWLGYPNLSLLDISETTCRLAYFLYGVGSLCSTNMFVCVTWDRLLTVRYPLFMRRCSLRPALITIGATFAFSGLSAAAVVFDVGFKESNETTACVILRRPVLWGLFSLLIRRGAIIQLVLIVVGNAVLVREILRCRRNRLSLTAHAYRLANNKNSSSVSQLSDGNGGQQPPTTAQRHPFGASFGRSVAQLWLALIYCLCAFPWIIALMLMHMLRFQGRHEREMTFGIWYVGLLAVFSLQGSTNWIIYTWRMPDYRLDALKLILCKRSADRLLRTKWFSNGGITQNYVVGQGSTKNSMSSTMGQRVGHRSRCGREDVLVLQHLVMKK